MNRILLIKGHQPVLLHLAEVRLFQMFIYCLFNLNDLSTFRSDHSMAGLPSNTQRYDELLAETPYNLTSLTDEQEGNFSNVCI